MNRTGLFIAIGLTLAVTALFGVFPELDLRLSALFYDAAAKSWPISQHPTAMLARDAAMWIAWAFALPSLAAFAVKMIRPDKPLPFVRGRSLVLLLVSLLLAAGILTNLTFKTHWGRPRPVVVSEFNGPWKFVPWWDPRGECGRNCSFFSGEGATAFWTLAPASLAPAPWRPLAYAAALTFGTVTSGLRMAFGGHFFTDVAIAGFVTYFVIWLLHALLFRWPATRTTDSAVDAALTRFAWPGFALARRLRGKTPLPRPEPLPATVLPRGTAR